MPNMPNVSKIKLFASCTKTLAPLEPLTLQQIQNEVQAGKSGATGDIDYTRLEALLQEKLKKFAAFNSCFGTGRPITYDHCGVDLEETRKAFALLVAMVWLMGGVIRTGLMPQNNRLTFHLSGKKTAQLNR